MDKETKQEIQKLRFEILKNEYEDKSQEIQEDFLNSIDGQEITINNKIFTASDIIEDHPLIYLRELGDFARSQDCEIYPDYSIFLADDYDEATKRAARLALNCEPSFEYLEQNGLI